MRSAVSGAGRTAGARRPDDAAGTARRNDSGPGDSRRPGQGAPTSPPIDRMPLPDVRDPVARTERTALEVVLQLPALVPAEFDDLGDDAFSAPAYRAVHEAIRAAGGLQGAREELAAAGDRGSAAWVARVHEEAARPVAGLVTELAVAPLPEDRAEVLPDYVRGVVLAILEIGFTRRIADLRGRLQRMDGVADPGGYQALFTELIAFENRRRTLRDSA